MAKAAQRPSSSSKDSSSDSGNDSSSDSSSDPTPTAIPDDIVSLRYEQARDELVQIVARLEAGQLPLEDSLTLWERGEALAAHCQTWLDQAEQRLAGGTAEVGTAQDEAEDEA